MDISLLNVKIKIEKSDIQTDEIGNRRNTWSRYYECFATVGGESGKEYQVAGAINEEVDITFTIRWSRKASLIKSTQHRIVFNEELYDIVAVDHMNFKKKSLKLRCRKARR